MVFQSEKLINGPKIEVSKMTIFDPKMTMNRDFRSQFLINRSEMCFKVFKMVDLDADVESDLSFLF